MFGSLAPSGLSLLGWLMGWAPDTYKMSHEARAIYSLWQSSPIPSPDEAELFSLLGMGKRGDLVPPNNQCSRQDKPVVLPAVILGEVKSLISKPGRQGSLAMANSLSRRRKTWFQNQGIQHSLFMVNRLSSGGYTNKYIHNRKVPCRYGWMAAALWGR